MTLLHEAVEQKKLDVRVVERNVDRGVIPAETVKKAVSSLPDDSENAEYVSLDTLVEEDQGSH